MNLPKYATLALELVDEHVLVATLNRPEVLNAISTQMGRDLLDLWTRLTVEPGAVRCAVLTGAGERAFCAGGDLKERNGMTDEGLARAARTVRARLRGAHGMPDPGDRGDERLRLWRRA